MKTNNSIINRSIFFKRPLFTLSLLGTALIFLAANVSCSKSALDAKTRVGLATDNEEATLMNRLSNNGHQHVNVRSKGAVADGVTDDTKAFQDAIDEVAAHGGGTVWVPPGSYSINVDTSIMLKSNVILSMADSARLIADTSSNERYAVIKATKIHNVQILGGQIVGDRNYHIGTTGEHGYGITISGCDNVLVRNTKISNCWGDGFIVAAAGGTTSTNITVKGIWSGNNRRQAISIIEVDGLLIDSCTLYNTKGTPPQDGIDIEPDVHPTPRTAKNITITNCDIYSNKGNGIEINARSGNIIKNIIIQYNKIHGNAYSGYCQKADSVVFTNNWLYENKYDANHPHNTKCTNSVFSPNTYQEP
jgi:polygalacturonase